MKHPLMKALAFTLTFIPLVSYGLNTDSLYYNVGGGSPFPVSGGLGHDPQLDGLGIGWNVNATCGNFDIGSTVSNQLNGVTSGFSTMMGSVVSNATSAVASLPAMIIQRANPGLYDLITNGVLQGRTDFDKSKLSCQNMANTLADHTIGGEMQKQATAQGWETQAEDGTDVVAAQQKVEANGGDGGTTWVGGNKAGGTGQSPIEVVSDTAKAGYNLLYGRTDTTSNDAVSGGGGGWGSVATNSGNWVGGGDIAGTASSSSSGDCQGGMCTIWSTPEAAANWTRDVLGDTELKTCNDCEKSESLAGTGLIREVENEQKDVESNLDSMVDGGTITQAKLNDVSAGDDLAVSRSVIEALRSDPQKALLTHRLAGEMSLARVLTKAMWAREALMAGSSDPGIESNAAGSEALDKKLASFNQQIDALKSEMEIRKELSSSAATLALKRAAARASGSMDSEGTTPDASLDDRGRPTQ